MSYTARKEQNMAKCYNCDSDSVYIVNNQGTLPQEFCDEHLPKFLVRTNLPDHVKTVSIPEVETPKRTRKKTAAK